MDISTETGGDATTRLEQIREDDRVYQKYRAEIDARTLAAHVPSLVAAVDAVLKLADDWEATAATLDGGTARANALLDCTVSFRAAITAALTGKESSDG